MYQYQVVVILKHMRQLENGKSYGSGSEAHTIRAAPTLQHSALVYRVSMYHQLLQSSVNLGTLNTHSLLLSLSLVLSSLTSLSHAHLKQESQSKVNISIVHDGRTDTLFHSSAFNSKSSDIQKVYLLNVTSECHARMYKTDTYFDLHLDQSLTFFFLDMACFSSCTRTS